MPCNVCGTLRERPFCRERLSLKVGIRHHRGLTLAFASSPRPIREIRNPRGYSWIMGPCVSPRAREEKKHRRSTCGSGRKVKGDEEEERKEETGFARSRQDCSRVCRALLRDRSRSESERKKELSLDSLLSKEISQTCRIKENIILDRRYPSFLLLLLYLSLMERDVYFAAFASLR